MSCVGEMHLTCCGLTQYGESFICIFWPFYSAVICISAENISWCRCRSQQILPDCFTFNKDWVLIPDSCGLIGFIPSCQWKLAVCFQVVHVCCSDLRNVLRERHCIQDKHPHGALKSLWEQKTHFEPEQKKVPHKSLIGWNDDASLRCDKNTHNRQTVRTLSQIMKKCHLNNVVIVKIFHAVGLKMSVKHPCLIMCNSSIFEPVSTAGSLCLCWTVFWFEFLVL